MRCSLPLLAFALCFSAGLSFGEGTEETFIPNYTVGSTYASWTDTASIEGGGSLSAYELSAAGDLPLLMQDKVKLTAGFRYRWNSLDFDGNSSLAFANQSLELHRLEVPANLWVDNGRWKYWLRLQPGLMSDFSDLDSDAFTLTVLGLASYRFNDKLTGGFGVYYSRDLGDELIIPALGLIWKPSPHWLLALTAPRFQVAYAPSERWLLTLNAYPSGGGWNVEDPDGEGRSRLNHKAARVGFGIDHRLGSGPAWVFVDGGIQVLQELELEGSDEAFTRDIDEAFFLNVGFKLRF